MIFKGKNFNFPLGVKTYIMGILNVTNDSFFDGGMYNSPEKAVEHAKQMLNDGADVIDIGAHSTRPGHAAISEQEELDIIKQYLPLVYNETSAVISVDTFYPSVAEYALQNGASIINDVSGKFNPQIARLVKKYNCGWIIMHTGGGDSSTEIEYKNRITVEVKDFFVSILKKCVEYGISENQIAFDVGIGFGKSNEQNLELIKNVHKVKNDNVALLVALSSKRVVANATNADKNDLVYGTISANAVAVCGGADIVRVHNVKENALAMKMVDAIIRG